MQQKGGDAWTARRTRSTKKTDARRSRRNQLKKTQMELLEKISGYTVEEAKTFLINSLKDDVVHEQALMVARPTAAPARSSPPPSSAAPPTMPAR